MRQSYSSRRAEGHDLAYRRCSAERLAAAIPGCRLETSHTAGHFSPVDEPDWLAGVVLANTRAAQA